MCVICMNVAANLILTAEQIGGRVRARHRVGAAPRPCVGSRCPRLHTRLRLDSRLRHPLVAIQVATALVSAPSQLGDHPRERPFEASQKRSGAERAV